MKAKDVDYSLSRPGGYMPVYRREALALLLRDVNAFKLLCLIAFRARWRDVGDDCEVGEAQIGESDYRGLGMGKSQYRRARTRLQCKFRYIECRLDPHGRGTFAKLTARSPFQVRGNECHFRGRATPLATPVRHPWGARSDTLEGSGSAYGQGGYGLDEEESDTLAG